MLNKTKSDHNAGYAFSIMKGKAYVIFFFERPEGTLKDLAELDVLRNCACSFLQHEPLSMGKSMLAASDVVRF